MVFPNKLKKGDVVAMVSPATMVKEEYVKGGADFLKKMGYVPRLMPGVLSSPDGSFASSREQRVADIRDALRDPEVKAIFCTRGGYGCVQLISEIPMDEVRNNPKWIIGFSDISALHALWYKSGVASLHAPMAKHLAIEPADDVSTAHLFRILAEGPEMDYETAPHAFNRCGHAQGVLRGGNLAVLNGLASTPFDLLEVGEGEDVILFIEDISEAIYAVERMLARLYLCGTLQRIKGLIVGRFTEYRPDLNHESMEGMIDALLRRYDIKDIPVAFNFPTGHVRDNYPLVEGAVVTLDVDQDRTVLKTI
ncbi:MAG: LD-carboxypeptidase [Muribaculaceae bacterium]|nr:LD-carboxypeptidase [Muribaculaceae bacterium]